MSTPQDPYATGPGDQPSTGSSPQPPSYGSAPQSPYTGSPAQGSYGQEHPGAQGADPAYSGTGYAGSGYGGQGGYGQRQPRNGLGIASLVLGILALLGSWVPVLGIGAGILAIVGLVLGIIGMRRAKRGEATNRGVALAGTILSALALLAAIVLTVVWGLAIFNAVEDTGCLDPDLSQTELEQCLEEASSSDLDS